MKFAGDVELAIGNLPSSLRGLYDIIYEQLPTPPESSHKIEKLTTYLVVQRTFTWILCAQTHLSTAAFSSAIWISDGDEDTTERFSRDQVLNACDNLVVHDAAADTFRFAHLSVREYLENRSDFNRIHEHGVALSRCFRSFDSPKIEFMKRDWDKEPFTVYARDNLVSHYRRVENTEYADAHAQLGLPEGIKILVKTTISGCCFAN
jgi:hypothetical protein